MVTLNPGRGERQGGSAGLPRCPQPGPRAPCQMLVVFKSAPILKRALKVKQAMMQLYVLKLLKVQTKYLGRQWRKSNMKTMSAIYQKVRHRLNDDWAYGNGKALARAEDTDGVLEPRRVRVLLLWPRDRSSRKAFEKLPWLGTCDHPPCLPSSR